MKRLSNWNMLIKPTHDCNLNCKYCYDKPLREKYLGKRMSFEIVDKILQLSSNYAENIQWIWHGGEPTLMGVEWYKQVQELFYKYSINTNFRQSMQSNGTLLNADWVKIEKEYGIEIGVSYDAFSQNVRVGSEMKNMEKVLLNFKDAGGEFGAISVINQTNYKRQIEMYEYFKNVLEIHPAFNHIYSTFGRDIGDVQIKTEDYMGEYFKYFKYWLHDNSAKAVPERSISTMLEHITNYGCHLCTYSDCRKQWISVNPVGVVYPCDRAVPDKYCMGDIMQFKNVNEIYDTPQHKLYSMHCQQRFMTHCKDCGYFDTCKGGCNATHTASTGNAYDIDKFYCEQFRLEFNGVYDLLRNIDISNDKFNLNFINFVMENNFVSVKELLNILQNQGIEFNTDYEYYKDKALLSSKEYKLFRLFNNSINNCCDANGHTDQVVSKMNYSFNWNPDFTLNEVSDARQAMIIDKFIRNKDTVLKIVGGEI